MHSSIFLFSFILLHRGVFLDMASLVIYPDFFLKILHCHNQIHFSTDSSNIFLLGIYYFAYTKRLCRISAVIEIDSISSKQIQYSGITRQRFCHSKKITVWVVILLNSKTGAEDFYHDLSPISRQIFIKNRFLGLSLYCQS